MTNDHFAPLRETFFKIDSLSATLFGKTRRAVLALLYSQRKAVIDYHPHHPADLKDTWADISRATSLLGWEPEVQVKEGFANTVRWYRDPEEGGSVKWVV